MQYIARLWTAVQRLRSEFRAVGLQYPTKYSYVEDKKAFETCSTILLPRSKSKVQVMFSVDETMLASWPESVSRAKVAVTKIYGSVE